MGYRIPSETELAAAIDNCLVRNPRMHSQNELLSAVLDELSYSDPSFRVSGERIRRVGMKFGLMTLEISYAQSEKNPGSVCPVCGKNMYSVRNRTLDGDYVDISINCRLCGYSARGNETRPSRYEITRKTNVDSGTRVGMLREARILLMRAADLMDGALRMSGMEFRSGNDSDTVRRIASDPEYGGSLRNIAEDMEKLEKNPVWTQPLVSPKNMFEKDRTPNRRSDRRLRTGGFSNINDGPRDRRNR